MSAKCEGCKHWHKMPLITPVTGQCRRNAPVVIPVPAQVQGHLIMQPQSMWPGTAPIDWCGEYDPKTHLNG